MNADSSLNVAELYPRLASRLRRLVEAHLDIHGGVVEDACQAAWTLLLSDPTQVDESHAFSWLATTARREALLMLRRSEIELRVIEGAGAGPEPEAEDPRESAERRERLSEVRRLPRRQQRIVWMHGLGYCYAEIARETGSTLRTVERQLDAARRRLASVA